MNCLEFRRRLLATPDCQEPDFLGHRHSCPRCAALATRVAATDRRIRTAMVVPAPRGLAPLAVLDVQLRRRRRRRRLGLAAALALLVLGTVTTIELPPPAIGPALVHHMQVDPIDVRAPAPGREWKLSALVAKLGGRLTAPIGNLDHAVYCPIQGKPVGHLVLYGRKGPVTAFLMPHHSVRQARRLLAGGKDGLIMPDGPGSIAVFGQRGEDLHRYERELASHIRWRG